MSKKMNPVAALVAGMSLGRHMTNDVAFQYRMGSGWPGDVGRGQSTRIEPCKQDVTNPIALYGHAAFVNTSANSVRGAGAGDTALTDVYGVCVRPNPIQQQSAASLNASFGVGAPPATGVVDIIREGSITVKVFGTPTKNGAAFLWVAASGSGHVQGAWEAAASGGNTAAIANARFNGPPDADGYCELQVWQRA